MKKKTTDYIPETIFKFKKERERENRPVVAKRDREGEGWTGSLGSVDTNYYI